MRSSHRIRGVGALLLALAMWGCAESDTVPASLEEAGYFGALRPHREQVFRYNNGAEPEHLDPGLMSGQPDGRIARAIFEGLVAPDPQTLEPTPGQAYRWEISEDLLTYTFHLRPGLQWSNGDPLTSGDFLWAWRRVLDPNTGSRYAGLLYPIDNAESFNKGEIEDPELLGIAAPDDSTFVVRLTHPTPYFLFSISFYTFLPVHRASIEEHGDRWTRPENIVSNGPFVVAGWRQGDHFELHRNPRYWDVASVRLDRIIAYSIEELSASTNLYKAGVIDWNPSGYIPSPMLPFLQGYEDFYGEPYHAVYFYSINVTEPPFDDVWVRRALNHAIDRETLVEKVLKGTRIPWGNMTPNGYLNYEHPVGIRFDPEYARECLAKAGYADGEGFPDADLLFNTSEDHRRIAEAIQAMWQQHLGIRVTLSNQEWASYLDATTNLRYQISRRSWIGDYPDPTTFLNCFLTGDGNNRMGWSNAEYDRLVKGSSSVSDRAERAAMLSQAEAILLDEAPVLPIYHYISSQLIKPYVRGLYPTSLDTHPLKHVWIDHDWRRGDPPPTVRTETGETHVASGRATERGTRP